MSLFRPRLRASILAAGAVIALAVLTACSSGATVSDNGLKTLTPGKLTIATGQPAYSPWVLDNKPQSGKGFESAVAYAVADKLGFAKKDVVWVRTGFDDAIAPGPKSFDLNIQQFSVTAARKKAVDFSPAYYTTTQAIVTEKGSPAADITTLAGLKKVKVAVAAGTTSYTVFKDEVGVEPQIFNSEDDAVLALKSGQVDAIATDLPSAFYLAGSELKGGKVIGQFADTTGGDKFAFVLPKNSPLTKKVTVAMDALQKDGTFTALAKKWLSTSVDVPILK
jgi:polar amino acid transport system substrate-binding protein